MKVKEVFLQVRQVWIPLKGYFVEETVAKEVLNLLDSGVTIQHTEPLDMKSDAGIFYIAVSTESITKSLLERGVKLPSDSDKEWVFFSIDENRCCWLLSSKPYFLYTVFSYVMENLLDYDVSRLKRWVKKMSFSVEKSTFDIFLTQYARLIRHFSQERYIREYARLGFTHIEVNALAAPSPEEEGVSGEFYSDFYTYCPALDQFVFSRLNQGIYPQEY